MKVRVEQETMQAIVYRRANNWEREAVNGPEASLALPSLAFTVPLLEVYEGLFDE